MQSSESQRTENTDDENLVITKGPITLNSLSKDKKTPKATSHKTQGSIKFDSETQSKTKARSRFSSAIRKFSRSGKKKEDNSLKEIPQADNQHVESTILSTGEDTAESLPLSVQEEDGPKLKKKKSLSKRFLLGSLKKSKISPKNSIDRNSDLTLGSSNLDRAIYEETSQTIVAEVEKTQNSELTATEDTENGSPKRHDCVNKVQITISGKKSSTERNKSPASSHHQHEYRNHGNTL